VKVGGSRTSTIRDIRRLCADRRQQVIAILHRRRHLETVCLEHPAQSIPQQEQVLGYRNAHGISRLTTVGPPGGLLTASTPSNAATLRSRAGQAAPP